MLHEHILEVVKIMSLSCYLIGLKQSLAFALFLDILAFFRVERREVGIRDPCAKIASQLDS